MKKDDFIDAMNELNPAYVKEADEKREKSNFRRSLFPVLIPAAAAVLIIFSIIGNMVFFYQSSESEISNVSDDIDGNTETSESNDSKSGKNKNENATITESKQSEIADPETREEISEDHTQEENRVPSDVSSEYCFGMELLTDLPERVRENLFLNSELIRTTALQSDYDIFSKDKEIYLFYPFILYDDRENSSVAEETAYFFAVVSGKKVIFSYYIITMGDDIIEEGITVSFNEFLSNFFQDNCNRRIHICSNRSLETNRWSEKFFSLEELESNIYIEEREGNHSPQDIVMMNLPNSTDN